MCLKRNIRISNLDDIRMFAQNFREHISHLRWVMRCIHKMDVAEISDKISFGKKKFAILGTLDDQRGIYPDPLETSPTANFPFPQSVAYVRTFQRLCLY
ncbi:retrovirus-related Pol polyprotein from transposon 297 [Trichonephila clavata]|uniref:Retrovirus-related Pol polyprotein from transposon 297 n=1 Tax=Trichonephila clavata TaxID=2740835 RepID=A0A8X6FMA6_TRICU|nr:retrovirus-related Pol polyprotein from transposon 297 [Trichonephila clavata]